MSEYTSTSGRRSSRGGRGRRPGGRNRGPRPARQEAPSQPKKLSFWQKIAAFFGGGEPSKPAKANTSSTHDTSSSSHSSHEARPKAEKPARTGFRKPEIVEVTSPRVYVGNLSFDATESDLFELFNGVGTVANVEVVANRHTQKSKGFAFVQMQSVEEAQRAVSELHDKEYMGRKLVVSGAKAVDEKRSRQAEEAEQPNEQQ